MTTEQTTAINKTAEREKVLGGEKIAVTGWEKGKSSKQSCTAEFQLWHMGQSLDPEKYITF